MPTDPSDDNLAELDWGRLVTWFAGLCRSKRASDCLPAALWVICSSEPPVGPGSGASPSELEALRALVTELRDRFRCLLAGESVPQAIHSPGPLTWKMLAENLKAALFAQPDLFRVYLWFTIDFFRYVGFRFDLADPAASEIRALLDYHDLYHPDLLPAVRRMTSSLPAARQALSHWHPSELSPQQKPLHRVDQIIDDATLSMGAKWAAILEVLMRGAEGKVVSH
jgi:hypothetical protein